MKKQAYIIIGIVIAALSGCNSMKMTKQLEAISKISDNNPDSALMLLGKYDHEKNDWDKEDRMHYELVRLKAENKSGVTFTSDSIIKEVVDYYKDKGNANQKMLAYYLLGRTYFDMEEAPEALQAFYDAISSADTISATCDYGTLTVVYGQMSRIFHKQNLPHDEIWALKHYVEYICRYESKKDYLIAKEQLIRPLYLLNEKDSVLNIINDTYSSLISQFSKDIPATYKSFGQGKSLSQLEQRICILLILNIPEKNISLMTDSYASTVSNAKSRANEKLYGKKDAHSLNPHCS